MSARGRPRRRGRVYRNVSSFRAHARAYAAFMRSVRVSSAAVQYTIWTELVDNCIVFHNGSILNYLSSLPSYFKAKSTTQHPLFASVMIQITWFCRPWSILYKECWLGGAGDYTDVPSGSKQNVGHYSELNNDELLKDSPFIPLPRWSDKLAAGYFLGQIFSLRLCLGWSDQSVKVPLSFRRECHGSYLPLWCDAWTQKKCFK